MGGEAGSGNSPLGAGWVKPLGVADWSPSADAPQLMELPRDVTVELGRSALLACRAVGRPPPTVTWRRGDGQLLKPRRGSRTGQPHSGVLFFESRRLGLGEGGQGRQDGFQHPEPVGWVAGSRTEAQH